MTESVPDGSAETEHVIGMKLGIIYDAVQVSFRADEEAFPDGVADVRAKMKEEVIGIKMGGATDRVIATAVWAIEKDVLAANTGHEISGHFFAYVGCVDGIYVIKDRTISLVAVIGLLLIGSGKFRAVAEAIAENAIDAEAGIESTLLRGGQKGLGSRGVLSG